MSVKLRFHTLDVFTAEKFCGKPLIVFDDADALAPDAMLVLAREFAFPAAAFLCAPMNPINTARLRVFTPGGERPFSAQAAIGAAVLLAQTRAAEILSRRDVVIALEMGSAVVSCEAIRNRAGVCYAQFALGAPQREGEAPNAETLARALSLASEDIGFGAHAPRIYHARERFLFAPIRSRDALECARPAPSHFAQALGEAAGLYLYTTETLAPESAILARLFDRSGAEDVASGEAAAAFAGAACEFEQPEDGEHEIVIEQGHVLGRLSRLTLQLRVAAGAAAAIHLGGQAVKVAHGEAQL